MRVRVPLGALCLCSRIGICAGLRIQAPKGACEFESHQGHAGMAELAYAADSNSVFCRFKSCFPYFARMAEWHTHRTQATGIMSSNLIPGILCVDSSAGRALALQARGWGFKSLSAHSKNQFFEKSYHNYNSNIGI